MREERDWGACKNRRAGDWGTLAQMGRKGWLRRRDARALDLGREVWTEERERTRDGLASPTLGIGAVTRPMYCITRRSAQRGIFARICKIQNVHHHHHHHCASILHISSSRSF